MRMIEGMFRRSFLIILVAAAAACSSSDNAKQEPPSRGTLSVYTSGGYSSDSGTDPVGVIPEGKLHDAANNRDVNMAIEYPIKAGSYPLIIFSHRGGGSDRGYEALVSYWTSYGYVTIRPQHTTEEDAIRDVRFILDSLDQLEQKYPELKGKIDRAHVGVSGHEKGAAAALVAASDSRVRAVEAMSAPKVEAATVNLRTPMLFMTGADAKTSQPPPERREAFTSASAGDKYLVLILGAREGSFTGRFTELPNERGSVLTTNPQQGPYGGYPTSTMSPADQRRTMSFENERRVLADIRIVSLAFWEAYLKETPAGRDYLASSHMNEGLVKTEKK